MKIANDTVVSIGYTLKNDQGAVLDQSGDNPIAYLHGHSNIVPGLEKVLTGLQAGDKTQASVSPEEGYGEIDPGLRFPIPRQNLGSEIPPIDTMVQLQAPDGDTMIARIAEIKDQEVILDANHPLAGQRLHFDVEVVSVRQAQPEELAHGHAHGPGGHHHH